MKRQHFFVLFIFVCSIVLGLHNAWATTSNFNILFFRPVTDPGPFHFIYESKNFKQLQWSIRNTTSFNKELLQEKGTSRKVIDRLVIGHFDGGLGLTDWLSFRFDLPVAYHHRFQNPTPLIAPGFQNKTALGDPRFEFKATVLDAAHDPVGLAFVGYATAPLGKEEFYLGDDTLTGGGVAILDTLLWDRLLISFNAGVDLRETVDFRNIQISTASFLYGLGAAFKITPYFFLTHEFYGRTPFGNFFKEKAESPAEITGSALFELGKGFSVAAGGGAGIIHGAGAPLYKAFLRLGYTSKGTPVWKGKEGVPPVKFEPITVYFDFSQTTLTQEAISLLDQNIKTLKKFQKKGYIDISGHADSIGNEKTNLEISQQRAQNVKDYLVAQKIKPERVQTKAVGSQEPTASNDTEEGRTLNRRAVVIRTVAQSFTE